MNKPNFPHSIEITANAFELLAGNVESSWRDFQSNELAEWSLYANEGCRLMVLHNFGTLITQYYVQDINA